MQTGMIDICAATLNDKSFDNCPGPLTFSFSADVGDSCRTFLCTQTYFEIPVEIWVTDAAGNQDFCATFIYITDNNFDCDTGIPITGLVATEENEGVEGVHVQVSGNGSISFMTGQDGGYNFADLEDGLDYSITPAKDIQPLNGVTTYDLVLITRHILGVQPLDSPYKLIAADANNSKSITTFDLVELRKLILFINDEFSNNTSWRFVEKSYVFPNPSNPWQEMFPEVINLNNLDSAVDHADFVAVKVGDVNGSANPGDNLTGDNGDRSASVLVLTAENLTLEPGQPFKVRLRAKNFRHVSGFQFTLAFDRDLLEFQSVVPTNYTGPENFGLTMLARGYLTASWHSALPISLDDGEPLIEMEFSAQSNGNLKDALRLTSQFTPAEAYAGKDFETDPEIRQVGLEFSGSPSLEAPFELYQNVPNPFTERTAIGFRLPETGEARLTVLDAVGRTVHKVEGIYPEGFSEIMLDRKMLPSGGVLIYRLETAGHSATRQMILLGH
jgi:hypothetical protein